RARPLADGRRDGARDETRRDGLRAERGDARRWRERGERGSVRGEGARDQRARALAVRVPVGLLARRALGPPCRARGGRRRPARSTHRGQAPAGPGRRAVGRDVVRADLLRLLGREPLLDEDQMSFSVNLMTRGPGERVAAMLSLFRGIADEILVALDDRAGPEVEEPLAAVANRVVRYPYADPVDRPLAWLHAE